MHLLWHASSLTRTADKHTAYSPISTTKSYNNNNHYDEDATADRKPDDPFYKHIQHVYAAQNQCFHFKQTPGNTD